VIHFPRNPRRCFPSFSLFLRLFTALSSSLSLSLSLSHLTPCAMSLILSIRISLRAGVPSVLHQCFQAPLCRVSSLCPRYDSHNRNIANINMQIFICQSVENYRTSRCAPERCDFASSPRCTSPNVASDREEEFKESIVLFFSKQRIRAVVTKQGTLRMRFN